MFQCLCKRLPNWQTWEYLKQDICEMRTRVLQISIYLVMIIVVTSDICIFYYCTLNIVDENFIQTTNYSFCCYGYSFWRGQCYALQ